MSNNTVEENLMITEPGRNQKQRNGMWNKRHRPDSVKSISETQKARYDYYRHAVANMMTEDRVREIIKETVQDYLANNAIQTNNNRPNNIPL